MDVLEKVDEEKMPDYAHSKNYKLLPHFLEGAKELKEHVPAKPISKVESVMEEMK